MNDPVKNFLDIRKAAFDGWLAATSQIVLYWQHVFDLQDRLFRQATTAVRCRVEIDDGPSFTGKYGKRRFDIDPERDV